MCDWIATPTPGAKVIDVGVRLMPYQNTFISIGRNNTSYGFSGCVADKRMPGFIEESYMDPHSDITSDIAQISLSEFDYALCTEIMEYAPDPVLAFHLVMNISKRAV